MTKLTRAELEIMMNLKERAKNSMRSKPTLRLLSKLADKGMIEFDPFAGTASITEAGREKMK